MAAGTELSLERTSVLAPDTQSRDQRTRRVQPKGYLQPALIYRLTATTSLYQRWYTSTTYPQHE
ncbi:hypothetical protein BDDG_12808 [Blastomyces dermatitidis ATCC 18188]|uniref:Uncharacterized protein n=1 Tax=Ajellomyces dermatitidis (strain ATCC 18188 / CBS 674.68) TaxID=653446 RepID=A0A0J9EQS9_AJEDA|nr:hypothetical protein BDDG_12808 [Blastomyces dermatitidis ATCC 18188]